MNERDFVYWLQGYLEVSNANELDESQLQIVKDHLALVLKKVAPEYDGNRFVNNLARLRGERDAKLCSNAELEEIGNALPAQLTC